MKRLLTLPVLFVASMLVSLSGLAGETQKEREAKQAELDAVCEAA